MTLDAMLRSAATGRAHIQDGWGQGRATYGGLVAALLVARARQLVDDDQRALRSASVTFAGPVVPGAATLDGAVLRAGSSATTVTTRLDQDGDVRALLVASFGQARETATVVDASQPRPELPAAEQFDAVPYIEGVTPEFFRHVELRFVTGGAPFSGAPDAAFGGWMRLRDAPERFGDAELLALADAWPPAISARLHAPAPMSTLTWSFATVGQRSAAGDRPDAHWQYDVRTVHAADGYAQTSARIWDEHGTLRALSRQTVAYFG